MNHTEIRRKQILILVFLPVIIGLMWFFNQMEGNGSGYFIICLQLCMFPIGCFMFFFPQVMEKLIRSRMSKGQYKNADRVWKGAVFYGVFVGLLSAIVLFILSEVLAIDILGIPNSLFGFRFLIPSVTFVSFCFVLKGYFQGVGSGLPTVFSDIIFYVCSGLIAYWFANGMKDYGLKVSALLHNDDFNAMYANSGASLGVLLGSILTMLFLIVILLFSDRSKRKYIRTGMKMTEDFPYVFRLLGLSMVPYILVGICVNLPAFIDLIFLRAAKGGDLSFVSEYAALFMDKGFYILFLIALILPGVIGLAGKYVTFIQKEEYKHARDCMHASFIWIFISAAFISVTLCVLGGDNFKINGLLVFSFVVAFFLGIILWKIGKLFEMVLIFAAGAVCHLIASGVLFHMVSKDADCIIYSYIIQTFLMIFLSGAVLVKNYRVGLIYTRTFLFPLLSTTVSGVSMLMLYKLLHEIIGIYSGLVVTLLCGIIIELVLLILLHSLRMKDMYIIPGGKIVILLGKRLHILD